MRHITTIALLLFAFFKPCMHIDAAAASTRSPASDLLMNCSNNYNITGNIFNFTDGSPVTIRCTVWAFTDESVHFVWYLNGQSIISPGSRITTNQTRDNNGFVFHSRTSLSFNPIYTRDSGNIILIASSTGWSQRMKLILNVIPQPTVIVSPLSKSIEENSQVTLTCNITYWHPSSNLARVSWMKNGTPTAETYSTHGLNWVFSILTVRENGNFTCSPFLGCASCSKYAIVDVHKKNDITSERVDSTTPTAISTVTGSAAPPSNVHTTAAHFTTESTLPTTFTTATTSALASNMDINSTTSSLALVTTTVRPTAKPTTQSIRLSLINFISPSGTTLTKVLPISDSTTTSTVAPTTTSVTATTNSSTTSSTDAPTIHVIATTHSGSTASSVDTNMLMDCSNDYNVTGIVFEFKDGSPATIYCTVWAFTDEIVDFEWYLNGERISFTSPGSRITTNQTSDNNGLVFRSRTSLSFNPIYVRDSGNLTLTASYNGKSQSIIKILDVLPQPTVIASPLSISIEENSQVNLTCNITYKHTSSNSIRVIWTADSTPTTETYSTHGLNWAFSVLTVRENGNFTCSPFRGCATCSRFAIVDIYKKDIIPCEKEIDNKGIKWPTTAPGKVQLEPCPSGYTGNIQRKCSLGEDGSGKWENPNNIECVRTDIQNVEDMIQDIKNGIGNPETAINLALNQLHKATNTSELTSGDIKKTSDLLYNIIDTDSSDANLTLNQETFYGTLDNMLSEQNVKQWEEISANNGRSGSFVLNLVSKSGVILGKQLNVGNSLTTRQTNLVVQIKKSPTNSDIVFPSENEMTGVPIDAKINFPKQNMESKGGNVISTSAVFKTVSSFLPMHHQIQYKKTSVESVILALSLDIDTGPLLRKNVTMHFNTTQNNITDPEISCAFWNFTLTGGEGWSTEGCHLVNSSINTAYCECNHLTNFAVLMSPSKTPEEHVKALEIISIIGCSISILGLLLTAGVYIFLWRYVKSGRSVLLVNLCFTLAVANLVFLSAVDRVEIEAICIFITALLHYLYLVVFFIMFAKGGLILLAVKVVFKTRSKIKLLMFLSWGVPAVIVAVTAGVSYSKEYHSEDFCWLTLSNGVLYSFIAPVVVVIVANLIIIMMVLHVLYTSHSVKDKSRQKKAKAGLHSMCTLLPILGVTWAFGVLSINEDLIVFQYLFAITNSLQGMFIFIFHCFYSPKVRSALRNRMRRYEVKTMCREINDQKMHSTQSYSA